METINTVKSIGVTIYPYKDFDLDENMRYIKLASECGFTRVFASFFCIDGKDISNAEYIAKFTKLSSYARSLGMHFQADLFPDVFEAFGATATNIKPLLDAGIDELRIDWGFTMKEIAEMSKDERCSKIIMNASAYEGPVDPYFDAEKQVDEQVREFVEAGGKQEKLEASHNLYPRPYTGETMGNLHLKRKAFSKYGIPISAFVPAKEYTYNLFDMRNSSPTVEKHRGMSASDSFKELAASHFVDSVFIGDGYVSEKELKEMKKVFDQKYTTLHVAVNTKITDDERRILFGEPHANRKSAYCMRGCGYRGTPIEPGYSGIRKPFMVTIDNKNSWRYAGEVNVVLSDMKADQRVNVIGYVVEKDRALCEYVQPDEEFMLVECTENYKNEDL